MRNLRISMMMLAVGCFSLAKGQDVTADAYFNRASKEYVKQDKMQALRTLDEALQKYPGDPKLLKLAEELVKEEEKKQQQQQQQQDQQDQQQKDQEKKDQEKKDQQQDQQKDQQQKEEQQKEQQQQQERAQEDPKDGRKGKPQPGSIAPQDALRMLDALERSEKDVQEKVRAKRRPAVRRTIEKDW